MAQEVRHPGAARSTVAHERAQTPGRVPSIVKRAGRFGGEGKLPRYSYLTLAPGSKAGAIWTRARFESRDDRTEKKLQSMRIACQLRLCRIISISADGRPLAEHAVMRSRSSSSWSIRLAGVALTLLSGPFLAAPSVQAGCGDYVIQHAGMPHAARPHPSQPAAAPATSRHRLPPAPGDKSPCSGPGCSTLPEQPAPAPVTDTSAGTDQWVWLDASPGAEPDLVTRLCDRSFARPVAHRTRVEHPPRPFSSHR